MQNNNKTNVNTSEIIKAETTRRNLLQAAVTSAGGLSLSLVLPGCSTFRSNAINQDGSWNANAWLEITPDNKIIFTLDRVEMGQGTYTGLTTLLAEELDVAPSNIKVIFAGAEKIYRNPAYGLQLTGGSNSLSTSWPQIRRAGASAKWMLMSAAAEVMQVRIASLSAENAYIIHSDTNKRLSYGSLGKLASKQSIPDSPVLKSPSDYRYIGKQNQRLDSAQKVNGTAVYGIDVEIDGMSYAIVSRAPYIGGTVVSHNGAEIEKMPGVKRVVEILSGIAIVADSYWKARKAEKQLKVKWQRDEQAPLNTADIFKQYKKAAKDSEGDLKREEGDIDQAFEQADKIIELEYSVPFLAHSTMEPMNCTAHIKEDKADIWTSTQAPDLARVAVARVTNLSLDDVDIHNQFIGGGFGRRLSQDFVAEAAEISYKFGGVIKLIWSREEDIKNDLYRPATYHKLSASLNSRGLPTGWDHQIVAPKIMDWYVWDASPAMFPWAPKFMYSMLGHAGLLTEGTPITPADHSPYEGADDISYTIPSISVRHVQADAGVPITFWRSVGHSHTAFVIESAIDELAFQAGLDPLDFRREYLKSSPRLLNVLEQVAAHGRWGLSSGNDVYQGIATHKSFGTYVGLLVEIKVVDNQIQLLKAVCAVDCGLVVNPDIVNMQMESGIIFGASAALYGEITLESGQVQQSNFHDSPVIRMNQSPLIETIIINSNHAPSGVGEPSVPPVAPAIANALFKAKGIRYRNLPFKLV